MQTTATKDRDTQPLKILYLLLHIPVPSETFVINEILALQSIGVDIFTVALGPSQTCHEELMARIKNPVYYISDNIVLQKAAKSSFYPAACSLAERYTIAPTLAAQAAVAAEYVGSCAVNHIHAHFATEAALVALLVSKVTGIPFSFTAHAYDIFRLNVAGETYPNRRLKLLVENAAKMITISDFNRSHILSITDQVFADKVAVVHCGVDLNRFNKIVHKPKDRITFLSVGRLFEKKGHEYLLHSFKKVNDVAFNVKLRIVGDGELRSRLTALVDELDITDKVAFLGAVSSSSVLNEMQNADIFVMHSITGSDGDKEGIPVSIMEACITGLPVVSTRHSGIPELVIEDVNGFLVEEKDCDGFAEAMCKLIFSPDLRVTMGLAGHSIVAEKFNLYHEAQKLKDIFIAIIKESSGNATKAIHVTPVKRFDFNLLILALRNFIKRFVRRD